MLSMRERVLAKTIHCDNGCWLWQGVTTNGGYGEIRDNGKSKKVHRVMWELEHGTIPLGGAILQMCDNRLCVNPAHLRLELKTPRSNDFWSKINIKREDECWEWNCSAQKWGYGWLRIKGKNYLAHRLAYEFVHGEIPQGLHVLHKCDNPPCCNPNHLFLGTQADNVEDMKVKGRGRKSVLSPEQREEIKEMYFTQGCTQKEIAEHLGLRKHLVQRAISHRYWTPDDDEER